MSLTPEELSEITSTFPAVRTMEYIRLGLFAFYYYYYLTTVGMEVKFMWPRKWHWGKGLFLVNRYVPLLVFVSILLISSRVYITLSPKSCTVFYQIFNIGLYIVYESSAEVALLLCLHALLGARPMYLTPIMATYLGLTLGATLVKIGYLAEIARSLPLSQFDQELGYACTWAGIKSPANVKKLANAGYISLVKALCIFALVLYVFLVRYRTQAGTFKLLHVLRRDSGVYILSVIGIRLCLAVVAAFRLRIGWYNIPGEILTVLNAVVVPTLANHLLLNMWKTEDPDVRKVVSSILFDPPRPGEDSEDDDEEFVDRPIQMVRYDGIGRRRALAREEGEGTLGGTGATQAAENGDDV
ncbi:hypothetical protein DFP72DRAFT_915408 [Ephemerocybe angulata]|uniref:DUF6533 domain-containing protein n=1 Tax=Ephemerocybe angulata TaxID=980116 RepID=A0A8H6HLW4_9AGAR|nr:hypothetical protein DFP72DRAFT_915408 [Tulosesus angulatus]